MLVPTYLTFIRYFYCACLTRPPDFWSRVRNLAAATQRIKIDKIESQIAPAEEADYTGCPKIKVSVKNFNSDLLITLIYSFLISLD